MINSKNFIRVIGAKQNNLKNITCEIPRNKLTVLTGLSGSGKSSLAYQVIYAEAHRRSLDSLSTYEKSRIKMLKKPKVDFVFGLSPAVALQQRKHINNPYSSVGTITDIYDFMRLLYATIGTAYCKECHTKLKQFTALQILERLTLLPLDTYVEFRVPVYKIYGEHYEYFFSKLREQGYERIYIDNKLHSLSDYIHLDYYRSDYELEVVIDSFTISNDSFKYLSKVIDLAMEKLEAVLLRITISGEHLSQKTKHRFYQDFGCEKHQYILYNMESFKFSYNFPSTSHCNTCNGVGRAFKTKPSFLITNPKKSLNNGALKMALYNPNKKDSRTGLILYSLSKKYGFSLDEPYVNLSEDIKELLFYGLKGDKIEIIDSPYIKGKNSYVGKKLEFKGFVDYVESMYSRAVRGSRTGEAVIPDFLKNVMVRTSCPECGGDRLKRQFNQVKICEKSISDVSNSQLKDVMTFIEDIKHNQEDYIIARPIIEELEKRVKILIDIGLPYISIFRSSDTLSGGELQRIFMSNSLSSELLGMIYIIDEPTIGLHHMDTQLIIDAMRRLADQGNTVIVIEHDLDIIKSADYILEMGFGAGVNGGEIIYAGELEQILSDKNSLTGKYISKELTLDLHRRSHTSKKSITVKGARANNLKDITVTFPLHQFVCVTGVSGSGKSSLVHEVLYKQLAIEKSNAKVSPGDNDGIIGHDYISNVINIDQSPAGRNVKSFTATYMKFFKDIRKIMILDEIAQENGYTDSDFSLMNTNSLRCEHCKGEGVLKTNYSFVSDYEYECPMCSGKRYNREALEVKYKNKTISDILDLTVIEAKDFFFEQKGIVRKLNMLIDLGLDYIKIGQGTNTLSGGELQRLKLARELSKVKKGSNLYIMDEPTTGLHIHDIVKLMNCIWKLLELGHSIVMIEHNLDVIKLADYVIDMGPKGGDQGGEVLDTGSPEMLTRSNRSMIGQCLRDDKNIEFNKREVEGNEK